MSNTSILENYKSQISLLEEELKALKSSINKYSYARLLIFALAILAVYLLFGIGISVVVMATIVMLISFLVLVKLQLKQQDLFQFKQNRLLLLENEVNILNEKSNIYSNGSLYADQQHVYTDDLDIFGEYSVFAYINRCATFLGADLLANWLKQAASETEIANRQKAVTELKNHPQETLDFRTRLFSLKHNQVAIIQYFFAEYLNKKLLFLNKKAVKAFVFITPYLNVGLLILAIILGGVFWSFLGLMLLFSGIGYMLFKKNIDLLHEHTNGSVDLLSNYAVNLKWIETSKWQSELLIAEVDLLKTNKPLHQEIKLLSKILDQLNARLNPIAGLFLNLFFQWDLKCLQKLQAWESLNGQKIDKGFKAISEFEALISLAVLSENHLDWINPTIYQTYHFKATNLGHPLIRNAKRVPNDFSLENHITIDVITGSNMAGKSTFLRTAGVNMVLAFAGAKVCAAVFETSVFNLLSYMRIKDSLNNETSTFKAEINRLKMILDKTAVDDKTFVLIDEMLRGTNSKDKYYGSKVFIQKLIAQQTPGFIATHDLQIADLEIDFPNQLRNFHFDIQIKENEMFFDYKIKNGECKTFNAAMLLKAIGLEIKE